MSKSPIFKLPVEQAVLVPSTIHGNRLIPIAERRKRVLEVKKYLSKKFGGYTSVSAQGGYYSSKKKKVIQEPIAVVRSFATKKDYHDHKSQLKKQLRKWAKKWKQESMGYEYEGDLFYYPQ